MLKTGIPPNIQLETDLPCPGPAINGDTNQLNHVMANLVTNAWEAMGDNRGCIRLKVKTQASADISKTNRFPWDWRSDGANYACLEVADMGCGMTKQVLEKIFDPFFSTKFTGRGMGLAAVLGIVRAHKGVITVESEAGRGSLFQVFLPLCTEHIARQEKKAVNEMPLKFAGTALVVDDEAILRHSVVSALKSIGLTVLEAQDGGKAVEVFQNHKDEIGFVLCDLTMPVLDGWGTIEALRQIAPGIPIILASGFSEAQAMAGQHPELPQAFLSKPYEIDTLVDTISRVMANRRL